MLVTQLLMMFSLLAPSDAPWGEWISQESKGYFLMDLSPLKTALTGQSDLNEKWKLFLLQELMQKRMNALGKTSMTKEEIHYCFNLQIDSIRVRGFEKEEFNKIKMHWINRLLALEESCSDIASSLSVLYSLEMDDLLPYIPLFFEKEPSTAHLLSSEQPDLLFCPVATPTQYVTPPEKSQSPSNIDAFYELPLSEHEKRLINELIRNMSERSIWGLLFKKREMERLGKRVNHVHPMRFISFILADPRLKHYLKDVSTSSFKWDHFIDGLSKRLKEEAARDNLTRYIPGMAHQLKFDPARLSAFIKDKDYEGMVKAILNQR